MEEQQRCRRLTRVSITTPPFRSNDTGVFLTEKCCFSKAREKLPSSCHQSLDVLGSPMSAMEYLSHSWSPSSSDILHTSSSNNLVYPLADSCLLENQEAEPKINSGAEDYEQKSEMKQIMQTTFPSDIYLMGRHSTYSSSTQRTWSQCQNGKNIIKSVISPKLRWKNWFGGNPVISFWGLSSKGRRKEELRLQTANIDAALSVVRLAAAIASITETNDLTYGKNSSAMACENNMNNVVSCAATLVAAVCAEAAESVGATTDLVASAVNFGFATQMPADIIDLTVSASTCLRGAATLRSWTTVGCHSQEAEVLLNSGTPLPVVMPTGERKQRVVSIKLRKMRLLLIVARKYLGAVLPSKQYTIVDAMEEAEEAHAYHCVVLRTNGGDMKLLFEEENQSRIWTSTVFRFLRNK